MAYMISSGQWWFDEKLVFVVFPLIAIAFSAAITRYKGWKFEEFLITSVFSWIAICEIGIFIYHTTLTDMIWHINRWVAIFSPVEDNTGMVLNRPPGYMAFWVFIFIVFLGISWIMYKDLKQKKHET